MFEKINRCVKSLKTELKSIMSKETYTKEEYDHIVNCMDDKLALAKLEKEQLEFNMSESKKISDNEFKNDIKSLKAILIYERHKRKALEVKMVRVTDMFIKALNEEYFEL